MKCLIKTFEENTIYLSRNYDAINADLFKPVINLMVNEIVKQFVLYVNYQESTTKIFHFVHVPTTDSMKLYGNDPKIYEYILFDSESNTIDEHQIRSEEHTSELQSH